jgi:hypothetical protein
MQYIFLCMLIFLPNLLFAQTIQFSSPVEQATLVELYTSEGCSSCPPADRWLAELKRDKRLWTQLVPVAFHVDYWNYLGWQDEYSKPQFTQRQQLYAQLGYARNVYTPGFFLNGREWRGFFSRKSITQPQGKSVGQLKLEIAGDNINTSFAPTGSESKPLKLNIALLGFNIQSSVKAGENSGKMLEHNFVVLRYKNVTARKIGSNYVGSNRNFDMSRYQAKNLAIAAWVTRDGDPTPIQATGGWLKTVK